jgi:hypothetical protein
VLESLVPIAAWIRRLYRSSSRRGRTLPAARRWNKALRRPRYESLEIRRLLTVTASITPAGALSVQISGTDTAVITEGSEGEVMVEDDAGETVFAGPQAASVTSITVSPDGGGDVADLTQLGASRDFTKLATLTVKSGADAKTLVSGTISTSGDQNYDTAVVLMGDANLTSASGMVAFTNSIDGSFSLATSGVQVAFAGPVGSAASLANLNVQGSGKTPIDLNAPLVHTTGAQLYQSAVTLTTDTTLISDTDAIQFYSKVDGAFSLSATDAVNTLFGDAVGGAAPLTSLNTGGAGTTFLSANVTTSGAQAYNQAVQISDNIALTTTSGGSVSFVSTLDDSVELEAPVGLTIDTTGGRTSGLFGQTQFNGKVGASQALAALTVTTGGPLTIGHQINTIGNILLSVAESSPATPGDDLTVAAGGALVSTAGKVELRAGDNLSLAAGSSITAAAVTLRGDFDNNDALGGTTLLLAGDIHSPTVTVLVGNGNNTINLAKTLADTSTSITTGSGNNTFHVSSAAPASGGTLSSLAGAVIVNGGAGFNSMLLDDRGDSAAISGTLTSSSITGLGMAAGITYSNLQRLVFQLASGASLSIPDTAASTAVVVNGGERVDLGGISGGLDSLLGAIAINGIGALNLDDAQASGGHTYDISDGFIVRSGAAQQAALDLAAVPGRMGVMFSQVAAVTINAGPQNNTFDVFLPLAKGQVTRIDGGSGAHNELHVVGSDGAPNTAVIGNFGSGDLIQVRDIECIAMYGAPDQTNSFINQTSIPSILIGGMKNDTLFGGSGPDVLFGGSGNDLLVAGGTAGSPGTDFTFADLLPAFLPNGTLNINVSDAAAYPSQSGTKIIDGGGGVVVFFNAGTGVMDAGNVTYMECDLPGSRALLQSIFNQALFANACLDMLDRPPTPPSSAGTRAALVNDSPFVAQAFQDILGRPVDPGSLSFWTGQLAGGLSRLAFASALLHSDEYDRLVIASAYSKYLGRSPDPAASDFWTAQMRRGLTDQGLEADLIGSAEYYARAGGTDTSWIDRMYSDLLGRPADAAGEAYWSGKLQSGVSRDAIAFSIANGAEADQQTIVSDYTRYLGRSPASSDINYWLNQLSAGATNEDVIASFVASDEYFARAGGI